MDKILREALENETRRQEEHIELIASENYVSKSILELQGSIFTNKYAEGYPGKRYYGGCEFVDVVERVAIETACTLFHVKYANVQPHSGSSANMAVYRALLGKGDTVLGMDLKDGGHLTHGSSLSFSGKDYEIVSYHVDQRTEMLDYGEIERLAKECRPRLIIAGASAYSRFIDFKRFREIADSVGAYLLVDMAHVAGLVAGGVYPSPVEYADVVTSTTHKTLRGPRGGLILTNDEEIARRIDKAIFPGIQGGPLMHIVAAKAQCFKEAMEPDFQSYTASVIKNAHALADVLSEEGFRIISGGTDSHLLLVDTLSSVGLTGFDAEQVLSGVDITVNKNSIPFDTEKTTVTSGIRLGTAAMTTRGLQEEDFKEIGKIIATVLKNPDNADILDEEKSKVKELVKKFPLHR